jgi:hypothetical protein
MSIRSVPDHTMFKGERRGGLSRVASTSWPSAEIEWCAEMRRQQSPGLYANGPRAATTRSRSRSERPVGGRIPTHAVRDEVNRVRRFQVAPVTTQPVLNKTTSTKGWNCCGPMCSDHDRHEGYRPGRRMGSIEPPIGSFCGTGATGERRGVVKRWCSACLRVRVARGTAALHIRTSPLVALLSFPSIASYCAGR